MSKRKTGLMYVPGAANYKAGDGYLYIPSAYSPWISTTDYYETPERVTEAYGLLEKSGLLSNLVPIQPRPATMEELTSFHSVEYIEKLKCLSEGAVELLANIARLGTVGMTL